MQCPQVYSFITQVYQFNSNAQSLLTSPLCHHVSSNSNLKTLGTFEFVIRKLLCKHECSSQFWQNPESCLVHFITHLSSDCSSPIPERCAPQFMRTLSSIIKPLRITCNLFGYNQFPLDRNQSPFQSLSIIQEKLESPDLNFLSINM